MYVYLRLALIFLISCNAFEMSGIKTESKGNFKHGYHDQQLNFDHGTIYDFGNVFLSQGPTSSVLTLRNNSNSIYEITNIDLQTGQFNYNGGAFPGTAGACALTSLSPGETCDLDIEFNPSSLGSKSAGITVTYLINNDAINYYVGSSLVGYVESLASLSLDTSNLDFGNNIVGSNNSATITITNNGSYTASSLTSSNGFVAPYSYLGGVYPGTGGDCGTSLPGLASCQVVIAYSPTATGLTSSSDPLSYFDGNITQSIPLNVQGTGANVANLTISETDPYSYGTQAVGSISNYLFTITNTGGVTATALAEVGLATPFSFSGGSFPGTNGSCTSSLNAGSNCTIEIEFIPNSITTFNNTITINYNDGTAAQAVSRNITGIGQSPALLSISEIDPYDFGTITSATSIYYVFTITNTGGVDATAITPISFSGAFTFTGGSYPGTTGNCGTLLPSAANCTIDITFTPPAISTYNDSLQLNYDDGATPQIAVRNITGTGN